MFNILLFDDENMIKHGNFNSLNIEKIKIDVLQFRVKLVMDDHHCELIQLLGMTRRVLIFITVHVLWMFYANYLAQNKFKMCSLTLYCTWHIFDISRLLSL